MLPPRMLQLQRSSSTLLTHNAATLFPTHRLAPASSRTHPRPLIVARAPWGNTNTNKKQQNQRGSSSGSKPRAAASSTEPATSFRIIIQGRNVTVTPAIKEHLESKLISAVSSFEAVIKEIDVKVKVHGGDATKGPRDQVTEVTVYTFRNGVVRVVERAENLYASIDLVADKLARSLRKLKEKALPKGKWPGHRATVKGGTVITQVLKDTEVLDDLPTTKTASLPAEVIRSKCFVLEPMDVEEAVEQLQFMSHDFFLFQDRATRTVQVLYRRKAGGYGVIVPEIGEARE